MNNKLIRYILCVIVIILFIIPMIFYFGVFLAKNRLHVNDNPIFNISEFYNIDNTTITKNAEVFNENKLIEYQCVFRDSCLSYINVGEISNVVGRTIADIIIQSDEAIDDPQNLITRVTTAEPYFIGGTSRPQYNVYKLPIEELSSLKMYNKGRIKSVEYISDNEVIYRLSTDLVCFALNDSKVVDLRYSIGLGEPDFDIDFIFTIDKTTGNMSIITVSKAR